MRVPTVAFLLAVVFAMVACNSKQLTRAKAAKIIKQTITFPVELTERVSIGEFQVTHPTFEAFMSDPLAGVSYKSLTNAGLMTLRWSRSERSATAHGSSRLSGIIMADLTANGRRDVVGDNNVAAPIGGQRQLTVRMCAKDFDTVTGITMIEGELGNKARVEYTWKFENKSPFETVAESSLGQGQCATNVTSSAVIMQLYDDGWRIVQ